MATSEVREFLETVLGRKHGWVELASLDRSKPGYNGKGLWEADYFAWPQKASQMIRCAEQLSNQGLDVYFSAHVMKTKSRKADQAVDLSFIHADLDREKNSGFDGDGTLIDYDKAQRLGAGVVKTSKHNFQVYMHLPEPVSDLKEYTDLCYRLGHTLAVDPSDVDAKVSPGDMMRFPGTSNHKRGDGFETEIIWPARRRGAVDKLVPVVPHIDKTPDELADASRSGMVYKIVNDTAEAGGTYEQAHKRVLRDFPDYDDDHPGDIRRIWNKATKGVVAPVAKDVGELEEMLREKAAALSESIIDGGTFIHRGPKRIEAIWGDSETNDVLWAPGEGMMITGATGVGKSTLAGLLVRGRMGYGEPIAGLPIAPGKKKVLYLALDRPAQLQRALRRQFNDLTEPQLANRLAIWSTYLPGRFENDEFLLVQMAMAAQADTIVVDSLKDALMSVNDEKGALAWNTNVRNCARFGIEVIILHHQRKEANGEGARKAKTIHDVYGSNWLTAGLGSVLLLWREHRKQLLELTVLKGPTGEGDKHEFVLNNEKGTLSDALSDDDKVDFFASPATPKDFAEFLCGDSQPKDVARARREIKVLYDAQLIQPCKPPTNAVGQQKTAKWYVRS